MDIRWLQDFLSLAEAGSFTVAADARHSSQPALSRRIQALEAWLGVELIDRSRYPTTLTPSGKIFRAHAAEMIKRFSIPAPNCKGSRRAEASRSPSPCPMLGDSRFPVWWKEWQDDANRPVCRLLATNVHDAVTASSRARGCADLLPPRATADLPRPRALRSRLARHGMAEALFRRAARPADLAASGRLTQPGSAAQLFKRRVSRAHGRSHPPIRS